MQSCRQSSREATAIATEMPTDTPSVNGNHMCSDFGTSECCIWDIKITGGEFIGGTAAFFADLYKDIILFKED